MNTKLLGGILLIVGTAIGSGMLALPIATSQTGFWHSFLLLVACWLIMTFGAFLILEVNLWLPRNSNLISMARATLGRGGEVVAWLTYLLLLYSLLSAYTAGGGDLLHNLLLNLGLNLPNAVTAVLFAFILSIVVYLGIRTVDYVNRGLMFGKIGAFILLVICILPFISNGNLSGGEFKTITAGVTVAFTAFGFATIVPSLRTYFHDDVRQLRIAILAGSLMALICYSIWNFAVMGIVPRTGDNSLFTMLQSGHSTSDFINAIILYTHRDIISILTRIFTSVCLATSFLGVALCLSDFLADGLQVAKKGKGGALVYCATFIPPLAIVLLDPGIFIKALSYAGIYCVILLILLPALMAWRGRYVKQLAVNSRYQVIGGKIVLMVLMIVSVLLMVQGVLDNIH